MPYSRFSSSNRPVLRSLFACVRRSCLGGGLCRRNCMQVRGVFPFNHRLVPFHQGSVPLILVAWLMAAAVGIADQSI